MALRVEIGPVGNPSRTYPQEDLFTTNPARVHTAKSDLEFEVAFDAGLRDYFFTPVRLYDDGQVLFRGEIQGFDWSERAGTTRVTCEGIEDDLSNQEVDRTFSNVYTYNAIQTIFDQDTGFDITVYDPSVDTFVDDQVAWSADTTQELADHITIPDDVPLVARNGVIETTPTVLYDEAENLDITLGTNGVDADANASGGEAVGLYGTGDEFALELDVEHKIPDGSVYYGFRLRNRDDVDGDGNFEGPAFDVSVDGTVINSFGGGTAPYSTNDDNYDWFTAAVNGSLDPGTHEIRWEVVDDNYEDGSGNTVHTGVTYIDVAVFVDSRHAPTSGYDNTTDSNDALANPPAHPPSVQRQFDDYAVTYNVNAVSATTSWADVDGDGTPDIGNNQQIAVSVKGSNTWGTAANSETIADQDFSATPSVNVQFRATWSNATADPTTTPSQGDAPQRLDSVTVDYDGDGRNVISQQTFQGDALSVLQQLHTRADYRFVIDHAATDANGDLTKAGEAFEAGDQTKTADWTALDRNPSESADRYANRVTIRGALQDDGTRPTATVQDDSEVNQFGVRLYQETRPDIDDIEAAISQARGELSSRVTRDVKGDITIPPQDILPGYRYTGIDWFDDGTLRNTDLERVELDESYQEARTRLVFEQDQDIVETVVDVGYQIAQTKQGV